MLTATAGSAAAAKASQWTWIAFFPAAYAAEQTTRMVDPQDLPLATWAWVVGLSALGWFASSAGGLASWHGGTAVDRYAILGRLATCMIAGLSAQLIGLYMALPTVLNFLAVIGASYAGDRFLRAKFGEDGTRLPGKE